MNLMKILSSFLPFVQQAISFILCLNEEKVNNQQQQQLLKLMQNQVIDNAQKNIFSKKLTFLKENMQKYLKKKHDQEQNTDGITNMASSTGFLDSQNIQFSPSFQKIRRNAATTRMMRDDFVRLFIDRVKRSSSKFLNLQKVNSLHLTSLNKILYDIQDTKSKKVKGIYAKGYVKLFITFLIVINILCIHFMSSFQIFFDDYRINESDNIAKTVLKCFCLGCSIIKIVSSLTFRSNYLGKRLEYILDIVYNYISSTDFYLDLLVLISTSLLLALPDSQDVGIFGFFATLTNVVYIERMDEAVEVILTTNTKQQIFALIRLLFGNFFIAHLIATIMITMAIMEPNVNWMIKCGIDNAEWWQQYFYSIYWASTVTTTVGFGDITISTVSEAIIIAAIMLLGCMVLSYNISQVGTIISSLSESGKKVKNQLSILRRLAVNSKMDEKLHYQIGDYLINADEIKRTFEFAQSKQLINMLPSHMQLAYATQNSQHFFALMPFFFKLSNKTKIAIYQKLKLVVLSPKQYITHKRLGLTSICILRMGTAGFAYRKSGSSLNGTILEQICVESETDNPQLLNINLFVRGRELEYDIICKEYCVISTLQYEDLYQILRASSNDNELYHHSMDSVLFDSNQWGRSKCEYCNVKHSMFVCPKLHHMPLRSIAYMRYQRGMSQGRMRTHVKYHRHKPAIVKKSLRLFSNVYVPLERTLKIDEIKKQSKRSFKLISEIPDYSSQFYQSDINFLPCALDQDTLVEEPKDYQNYFPNHNISNLRELKLKKKNDKPIKSKKTK